MENAKQLADRVREVILSGTWIANTNFADQLSSISWKQSTVKIGTLNSIAALTFHINYYISGLIDVLNGGPLEISDKYSFNLMPINDPSDWDKLRNTLLKNAETFASLIEQFPESKLEEPFVNERYGTFRRNLEGVIEHSYYHLGQISLIKKLILESES